jgi:hypothetical protein
LLSASKDWRKTRENTLSLTTLRAVRFRIEIRELDDMANGNRLPVLRNAKPLIINGRFNRQDRAGLRNNYRAGFMNIDGRGIGEFHPKRTKWSIMKLPQQVVVGHNATVTESTLLLNRLQVVNGRPHQHFPLWIKS